MNDTSGTYNISKFAQEFFNISKPAAAEKHRNNGELGLGVHFVPNKSSGPHHCQPEKSMILLLTPIMQTQVK
jgi:hypothetical protein